MFAPVALDSVLLTIRAKNLCKWTVLLQLIIENVVTFFLEHSVNTSSGYNDLPCWIFKQCSYELSSIVATIFNKSFQTGTVPVDRLTAVVTPAPKIPRPTGLTDYHPISVTPILSRVAENPVCVISYAGPGGILQKVSQNQDHMVQW